MNIPGNNANKRIFLYGLRVKIFLKHLYLLGWCSDYLNSSPAPLVVQV